MVDIDLTSLNSVTPYHVGKVKEGVYVFQTEGGTFYTIMFDEDMQLAGCQTYQFIIERDEKNGTDYGYAVRDTILSIIYAFFGSNNDILLYICDTSDGKETARNRLFLRWFKASLKSDDFIIKNAQAIVEDSVFYAAIIVRKDNPKVNEITEEFDYIAENIAVSKS